MALRNPTQLQILDFGEVNFLGTEKEVRRTASGAGIIFLNAVLPYELSVRFDDNKQSFRPVPKKPIYYNFSQSVTLKIKGAVGGSSSFGLLYTPSIKALILPEPDTGYLEQVIYEPVFRYDMLLGQYLGSEIIQFSKHLGWKEIQIGLSSEVAGVLACYHVYGRNEFDSRINTTMFPFDLTFGYLSISSNTPHYSDYLIIKRYCDILTIEQVYKQNDNSKYLTVNFVAE